MNKKPEWLKVHCRKSSNITETEKILKSLNINTVCREAKCPNYNVCFSKKTATFMIMGTNCTRNCLFCNVNNGIPHTLNTEESNNIAQAVKILGLRYVIVTSVSRDDLKDGGAEVFAKTISEIKRISSDILVEVLIPDFGGSVESLATVVDAQPHVISHNIETIKAFYSMIRPQADYKQSLNLLKNIKKLNSKIYSKSGIMLGFGESKDEVCELFDDLREYDCDILTIGQYLSPSKQHYPVQEYISPELFKVYREIAVKKGFIYVTSDPLVRSSYNADAFFVLDKNNC